MTSNEIVHIAPSFAEKFGCATVLCKLHLVSPPFTYIMTTIRILCAFY
jgi:hypothetical protein